LDPELNQPYHLKVVLYLSDNAVLTPVFCDKLKRDLHDSLEAALGKLARVEVIPIHQKDLEAKAKLGALPELDPVQLKDVQVNGLRRPLDGWNFITGTKLHFVFVDYVDGRYEIQARQYDGVAGLASPVVRTPPGPITDRQLVARSAALLISEDFGVVGRVVRRDGDKVDVAIKGGGVTGASLSPWLRRGDIFAVTQIVSQKASGQAPIQHSYRQDWTLLQVTDEPQQGVCHGRLFYRFENPLPLGAGVLGYRCLQVRTIRAPLRLRVVAKDSPGTPLSGRTIEVRAQGFEGPAAERLSTPGDGLIRTQQSYDNAAFVLILDNSERLAQVPVQLVDDRPVTVAVDSKPGAEKRGQLLAQRGIWLHRAYDARDIAVGVVADFNKLIDKSHEGALAKLEEGMKSLHSELPNLSVEHDRLAHEAASQKVALDLSEGERVLEELRDQEQKFQERMKGLKEAVAQANDPGRRKLADMAVQAQSLEDAAEYEKAIALYDAMRADAPDDKTLENKVKQLHNAWDPKSPEHQKARAFIYETLPKVANAAEMKAKLEETQKAFEVCRRAEDTLTPRKLLKVIGSITAKLVKELETLSVQNDDDRRTAETIKIVSEEMRKLSDEATEFLTPKKGKK
jgi:hypothetical protein